MLNLFQVVNQPTRGANVLDLILTSAPNTVNSILYLEGFSDHNLLQLLLDIPLAHTGSTSKMIRDYNKANYDAMNIELEDFFDLTFLPSFSSRSVNENWLLFKDKMLALIDKFVPLITISNDQTNRWFNKSLNKLRNKKKALIQECNANKSSFSLA